MRREPVSGFSKAATPGAHRFPTVTLMCSVGLLVTGMRLADVLPLPHLPRFSTKTFTAPADAAPLNPMTMAPVPGSALPPGFPAAYRPQERITLQDVSFQPIQVPLWPMASRLVVRAEDGRVTLSDPRSNAVVWGGRIADAHFEYSNISGNQILSDRTGQIFWSDIPTPDLLFEKNRDGRARLSDKNGKTLWAGTLNVSLPTSVSRGDRRGTTVTLDFAGIRVNGINGYFTVIDGTGDATRILWSGTLPVQPVMLFREEHRFFSWGADRSDAGSDRTTRIKLTEEKGRVAIADAREQILGEQPVTMLRVESVVCPLDEDKTIRVPQQYCVPYGSLAKSGSVLFRYLDRDGNVVRKNSVVREGDRERVNNNGLPY